MTATISPINPDRACTDCGVTVIEWDPADEGCIWPDGKKGCWSGFSADGKSLHTCRSCGEKKGYPLLDRTCPKCKMVFESADAVDEHFVECEPPSENR